MRIVQLISFSVLCESHSVRALRIDMCFKGNLVFNTSVYKKDRILYRNNIVVNCVPDKYRRRGGFDVFIKREFVYLFLAVIFVARKE